MIDPHSSNGSSEIKSLKARFTRYMTSDDSAQFRKRCKAKLKKKATQLDIGGGLSPAPPPLLDAGDEDDDEETE